MKQVPKIKSNRKKRPSATAIIKRLHERQAILDQYVTLHQYPSYARIAEEIENGSLFENDFSGGS